MAKKIEIDSIPLLRRGQLYQCLPNGCHQLRFTDTAGFYISYLNKVVSRFREQAQTAPVILFHDNAVGADFITDDLAGDIIPVALEEITVASLDHWLSVLAWGARQSADPQYRRHSANSTQMLKGELSLANSILDEMGQPQRISPHRPKHACRFRCDARYQLRLAP